MRCAILVPFALFKKREKHPRKSVNFTKINTPPWKFFIVQMEVLNCTNGTKSRNASRIFNFSFKTGVFPDSLKINKMTLIHKEDSKLII